MNQVEPSLSGQIAAGSIAIRHKVPTDRAAIETLNEQAFGPGRFARTAFRLREGSVPEPGLCFVACCGRAAHAPRLCGSVELTGIAIADQPAWLLGPLVVSPDYKNMGIGRELMNRVLAEDRLIAGRPILLVGDLPYYERFGFRSVPHRTIMLPGPVDPARILLRPGNRSSNASDPLPAGPVTRLTQSDAGL